METATSGDQESFPRRRPTSANLVAIATSVLLLAGAAFAGEESLMKLSSSAFAPGGSIPAEFTCVGQDASPPLSWAGAPVGTRSFSLIVDDPDAPDPAAPKRTWVHWVLYNLPPEQTSLSRGVGAAAAAPARDGHNDWGRPGYGGPCPPIGRHRYFFKLYALDVVLPALEPGRKDQLEAAMKGHVLASAELVGTFEK